AVDPTGASTRPPPVIVQAMDTASALFGSFPTTAKWAADPEALLTQALVLCGIVVGTQCVGFVQTYTMQIARAPAMADLRGAVFDFLQRLELRYYDRTPVGRLEPLEE